MNAPSPDSLAMRLRDNKTDGAAVLARQALTMLRDWIAARRSDPQLPARTGECARVLAQARPSMGAIGNLVRIWLATLPLADRDFAARAVAHCDAVLTRADCALQETVGHARARLGTVPAGSAILTHSASSTVGLAVAERAANLIVTASEPGGEGRRLARELGARCIEDADAVRAVGKVAAVVVGADAVGRKAFVNKVGTARLATAAQAEGTPFYVAAESYKWLPDDTPVVAESNFEAVPNGLVTEFVSDRQFSRALRNTQCCAL